MVQLTLDVTLQNKPTTTYNLTPVFTVKGHSAQGTPIPIIKGASAGQHYQSMASIMATDIVAGDAVTIDLGNQFISGQITNPNGNNTFQAII